MTYRPARYNVHGAWVRSAPRSAGSGPVTVAMTPELAKALAQIDRAFGRPS